MTSGPGSAQRSFLIRGQFYGSQVIRLDGYDVSGPDPTIIMASSFSPDRAMVKGHQRIDTRQSHAEHDQGPCTFAYCLF
jgi:hypothetical protein